MKIAMVQYIVQAAGCFAAVDIVQPIAIVSVGTLERIHKPFAPGPRTQGLNECFQIVAKHPFKHGMLVFEQVGLELFKICLLWSGKEIKLG